MHFPVAYYEALTGSSDIYHGLNKKKLDNPAL